MTQDQLTDEREALLKTSVQDSTSKSFAESELPSRMPTLHGIQKKLTSQVSPLGDDRTQSPHGGSSEKGDPVTAVTGDTARGTSFISEATTALVSQADQRLDADPVLPSQPRQTDSSETSQVEKLDNKSHVTFEDYLCFRTLSFIWAESYDTKDFARLSTILAPNLNIDYSVVAAHLPKQEHMLAGDFLAFVSSPHFLGDPLIHTQHLLGASTFDSVGEDEVLGCWQIRAAHQRYTEGGMVECRGHGHAMIEHRYRRTGDEARGKTNTWKLAGVKPNVRWNEGSFDSIFRGPE